MPHREYDHKIAEVLGITYEELNQTDWELDTDGKAQDYQLIIKFGHNSPQHILDKIQGLTDHSITIDPNRLTT